MAQSLDEWFTACLTVSQLGVQQAVIGSNWGGWLIVLDLLLVYRVLLFKHLKIWPCVQV